MKIELSCPRCGRGHLVEVSSGAPTRAPERCGACGARLRPDRKPAPRPSVSEPAAGRAIRAEMGAPARSPEREAVPAPAVCPRCGHRFVPEPSPGRPKEKSRPRILLVEDVPFFQETICEALRDGYEVLVAASVPEALQLLGTTPVDLLVLDRTLRGGADGAELLRALPVKPCPVLVLCSGEEEPDLYGERWADLRALGVDDVAVKGIQAGDTLARKVAELLGKSGEKIPSL